MKSPSPQNSPMEDSSQESEVESLAPDTPLTPTSPKKPSKSRDKYLPCPYPGCEKMFNRPARLEEHKRSHTNERIFKCPEPGCNKDFLRKTHLKRHIDANHASGQKTHVCKYEGCEMSFVTKQHLKRHYLYHEKRDKYRCTEPGCNLSFRKHNTLNMHIRTAHQGLSAFPCDEILEDGSVCPKGFASAHYLKLHKGQAHGARNYQCTLCPAEPSVSFATFSEFQEHTREVHPSKCEICGWTTKHAKKMAAHVHKHHSDEPLSSRQVHICPYPECNGKGFVEKKNLNNHIRTIHQDSKPFHCGDTELNLNHVEGWDFSNACDRAFSYKATLENHIRVMHMGLPSMDKKRKGEDNVAPKPAKRSKPTKLDHLTGNVMNLPNRTIPCPRAGCKFAFTREWDKLVHLDTYHGDMADDDSASQVDEEEGSEFGIDGRETRGRQGSAVSMEEQLEAAANAGGPFWIGGMDEDYATAGNVFAEDALFAYGETCLE